MCAAFCIVLKKNRDVFHGPTHADIIFEQVLGDGRTVELVEEILHFVSFLQAFRHVIKSNGQIAHFVMGFDLGGRLDIKIYYLHQMLYY